MSRIGKKPVVIPKNVSVEVKDKQVFVEGPKGKLSRLVHNRINIEIKENQVFVRRVGDTKLDRSLHGLYRSLISNMTKGVLDGYTKELEIIGVGFKAQIQGKSLLMNLGFSHQVNLQIPEGITVQIPKPTQIVINGIDKEQVGRIATEIRAVYPPEPYKGKGIRFIGEQVKKKVGKSQAASK